MPIDLNLLREDRGGNPELVRVSERRRGRSGSMVDKVLAADGEWREINFAMESAKRELNALNKQVGQRKKVDRNDACQDIIEQTTSIKAKIAELEESVTKICAKRDSFLHKIGNIVAPDVRDGKDESQNEVVRTWGKVDRSFKCDGTPGKLHHHEIMQKLGIIDLKKGSELAGHRGFFLKGKGVMLSMAIINYGLSFLRKRGYEDVQPPYFMRREVMQETAELADFNETLYKIPAISGEGEQKTRDAKELKDAERDDLFLIATSEQPISALHRGEYVEPKSLPIHYCGFSTCFRKEAGSHGRDMWGIFRVHQFEKVEQFCLSNPEDSPAMHEQMIKAAEEFYQSLELPYRVVVIVAGALNDAAAKKYDLEAWFPGYEDYRELVSCSNCTDFQSRGLNVRWGHPKQGDREKHYVHMLNATLVAVQRAMCCILENYQTPDGVRVPRVLVDYMEGIDFLPYPKENADKKTDNEAPTAPSENN